MNRIILAFAFASLVRGVAAPAVDLGDRRMLFVDDTLIEKLAGLEFRLHPPQPRETVFTFDAPWEGSGSDFERLIRDGNTLRMYYMGTELTSTEGKLKHGLTVACLAESKDGIHWTRPDLNVCEFQGSRHNNIIWTEPHLDNFTPFIDANPRCAPEARYKAMGSGGDKKLFAFQSPDGIHWRRMASNAVALDGQFDSQNNAFWDSRHQTYWCYFRGFHDTANAAVDDTQHGTKGIRDIRVSTSGDFIHWSKPRQLQYGDAPEEALYTSQIEPYYRAPDLFIGFPTRYLERNFSDAALAALPDPDHRKRRMAFSPRYGTAITDGLFMTSRNGYDFHRWEEPFIPPGPERNNNWVYGDGYQSLGLVETPASDSTSAPELSCYVDEGHWKDGETLRRYTMRIDGFVSLHASRSSGQLLTKKFIFRGRELTLNFSTSAAGRIRVQLEDGAGNAVPGHALAECDELFGDSVGRMVTWKSHGDISAWAQKTIRLRFDVAEADLYSLQFQP